MRFEWDDEKERKNIEKHKIDFETAAYVFNDADRLEIFDELHSGGEDRLQERKKQTVTLRLSPQALEKAKSLGKGYTSVLSRILENALNDIELIKQNL